MIWHVVAVVLGFLMLIKGATMLVAGSSSLAKKLRVSELVIGLTIVAFGTSMPELVVNVIASVKGFDSVVMGNVLGSNIFNLLLILGLSGVIFPIAVQTSTVWKEIPFSLIAALVLLAMANDSVISGRLTSSISRIDGIILLIVFVFFVVYVFRSIRNDAATEISETKQYGSAKTILFIVLGLIGLLFGGRLVVENSISIAKALSISERIIGLTIVSIGTSLPELVTSVVAAMKKKSDLAIGNVIGSNIFNIYFILGISATIAPINFPDVFNIDIGFLVLATVFLLVAMLTGIKKKLDRWEAGLLLVFFGAYLSFLIFGLT